MPNRRAAPPTDVGEAQPGDGQQPGLLGGASTAASWCRAVRGRTWSATTCRARFRSWSGRATSSTGCSWPCAHGNRRRRRQPGRRPGVPATACAGSVPDRVDHLDAHRDEGGQQAGERPDHGRRRPGRSAPPRSGTAGRPATPCSRYSRTIGFCTSSTAIMTPTTPATTVATTLSIITAKNTRPAGRAEAAPDADLADALPHRHERDVEQAERAEQQDEHRDPADQQLERAAAGRRRRSRRGSPCGSTSTCQSVAERARRRRAGCSVGELVGELGRHPRLVARRAPRLHVLGRRSARRRRSQSMNIDRVVVELGRRA